MKLATALIAAAVAATPAFAQKKPAAAPAPAAPPQPGAPTNADWRTPNPDDVLVIDNLAKGHRDAVLDEATFLEADLMDRPVVARHLREMNQEYQRI